jgi:hypothetical protein
MAKVIRFSWNIAAAQHNKKTPPWQTGAPGTGAMAAPQRMLAGQWRRPVSNAALSHFSLPAGVKNQELLALGRKIG